LFRPMSGRRRKINRGPLVGAHMSIAGGVENAILHAENAGCPTVQMFNKSNNQWAARPLSAEEVDRFHAAAQRTGIAPIISHTAYLINCASPDSTLYKRSVKALEIEYARCDLLKIDYLVMHPGAHIGSGAKNGIERIARALNTVLGTHADGQTMICLEATAGAGSIIGSTFDELRAIIDLVEHPSRVGVCLDTCHIFAAGYDIRTIGKYKTVIKTFDRQLGLDRLRVWHLNDSQGELGSRKDRHEHIGKGLIGKDAFGFILRDRRFAGVPKILETPKMENGREMDRVNLALLLRLARHPAKK